MQSAEPEQSFRTQERKRIKKREKQYGGVEHTLANNAPRLVGIGVVANDLGGDHKRGDEKAVTRRALCGGEASLEALKEIQRGKGNGNVKARTMERVRNKVF